jgi:hypothetical protein
VGFVCSRLHSGAPPRRGGERKFVVIATGERTAQLRLVRLAAQDWPAWDRGPSELGTNVGAGQDMSQIAAQTIREIDARGRNAAQRQSEVDSGRWPIEPARDGPHLVRIQTCVTKMRLQGERSFADLA